MKTKTAAIHHARENVSLVNMGKQWRVNTYSEQHRAWWQGTPSDYWQARANYSQACLDSAREFLELDARQYDGGKWTDSV